MVTLIQNNLGVHTLSVRKQVGSFRKGDLVRCRIQPMSGRIYKPGKHFVNGKEQWIDVEGKKDDRFMVYASSGHEYAVINSVDHLNECFDEIPNT